MLCSSIITKGLSVYFLFASSVPQKVESLQCLEMDSIFEVIEHMIVWTTANIKKLKFEFITTTVINSNHVSRDT